ncbi:ADP-ribose pyrophosphatase [Photobacterium proteolyticum]|uniref:GDP-mannose pyrophosphatase n=1 Tax=Photobacterium proteolyticum TaxID=1903952 RepID=A0A1Q9GAB9_9GAMM|nr:NUDIX hydrolase [Photobacterium proteolyticum]OLQ71296.1 ADP-ribose pyrophosphatase [Photobacterium proteolyticum]
MKTRTLCQWKCFSVEQATHSLPDGRQIDFTTVKHPGAVVILPVTNNGELVMVRQYRPAIQKWILEFPAGTLESQEDILSCAKRELAEEVQLKAELWQDLGELLPVPGFCDEVQYLFFAKGLTECTGELDDDEIIEVITLSVNDFEMKVASGEIQDAKTLSTFFKARMLKLL